MMKKSELRQIIKEEIKYALRDFHADKIDDKIEFLLNGDYDDDKDKLVSLKNAISKLANTPKRKKAIEYINNILNK